MKRAGDATQWLSTPGFAHQYPSSPKYLPTGEKEVDVACGLGSGSLSCWKIWDHEEVSGNLGEDLEHGSTEEPTNMSFSVYFYKYSYFPELSKINGMDFTPVVLLKISPES